jgi:hypothetical protein
MTIDRDKLDAVKAAIDQEYEARGGSMTPLEYTEFVLNMYERFGLAYSRVREDGQRVWGFIPKQKQ